MIIFLPGTTFNHLQHTQPYTRSFLTSPSPSRTCKVSCWTLLRACHLAWKWSFFNLWSLDPAPSLDLKLSLAPTLHLSWNCWPWNRPCCLLLPISHFVTFTETIIKTATYNICLAYVNCLCRLQMRTCCWSCYGDPYCDRHIQAGGDPCGDCGGCSDNHPSDRRNPEKLMLEL